MNNWEKCRMYGVIQIMSRNNQIRLYYNQFEYLLAQNPQFVVVMEAQWQGSNLIVRGTDRYGRSKAVVMTDFFTHQNI